MDGIRQLVGTGITGALAPAGYHEGRTLRYDQIDRVTWRSQTLVDIDGHDPRLGYVVIPSHGSTEQMEKLCVALRRMIPALKVDERQRHNQFGEQERAAIWALAVMGVAFAITWFTSHQPRPECNVSHCPWIAAGSLG